MEQEKIYEVVIHQEQMLTLKNPLTTQLMQCLVSQDQVKLLILEKNMNLQKAIDGTKIIKLEKTLGEINMVKVVTYLLMRFSESFNVGKNITNTQAPLIAIDIIEKYPYETIEDLVLLLKQVRQGIIGDGKDYKLDGQNILNKWFPEYLEKKYIEFERMKKQENVISQDEKDLRNNAVAQLYAKRNSQKARKEREEKTKLEIDEMVKNMDRQMLEDTIASWEKQQEMEPYLDYLRQKRLVIKGDYKF
jgi:hypothetical protein